MPSPIECPADPSAGFPPGFVERARNQAAACLRAMVCAVRRDWLSARFRLLLLSATMTLVVCGAIVVGFISSRAGASQAPGEESPYWTAISGVDLKNLTTVGKNPYFNLEPGYRLHYADGDATLTITVRRKTKVIEGVETRVVEEKEEHRGQPTKIVWKYYAIDKTTSAVYCFGVRNESCFKGRVLSRRGWRSGARGAMFTLVLPAAPKVGETLLRNHSPDSPRRQEEVTDVAGTVITPAGTFTNCVCTETLGSRENRGKVYAPGVGMVHVGQFDLVKIVQTVPSRKAKAAAD
jgi:hypothetical protein